MTKNSVDREKGCTLFESDKFLVLAYSDPMERGLVYARLSYTVFFNTHGSGKSTISHKCCTRTFLSLLSQEKTPEELYN